MHTRAHGGEKSCEYNKDGTAFIEKSTLNVHQQNIMEKKPHSYSKYGKFSVGSPFYHASEISNRRETLSLSLLWE